ncbi:putative short transient receptor potential channel 2-like protein isoform X3 [Lontra canadensis]|uniref:putative short transient receptor potential channel 2-like protein isoform X3 n=1 Tax=Lontra canadensis TaxID=76717 RepID=UPI0013F30C98|nr:putative short transient receptor potential channel 2-like protein isoform X3 [Lontra canadensis]
MAPVKISHVVSFSSQDPKYPVENLLNPDSPRGPWLSSPQDKSGQLKVELQLERAVPIGYIDVDDFLAPASGESWDRLRLTCSQPFTHQQSFGLAFLRVCSSLDSLDDPVGGPSAPESSRLSQGSDGQESSPSPWLANPSIRRTFFPDPQTSTKEISELKNILKQLQPGPLGRSARMVLSAARRFPPTSMASRRTSPSEPGPSQPASTDLMCTSNTELRPEEQNSENHVGRTKRRKVQARRTLSSSNSRPNQRGMAKARQRECHRRQAQSSGVQNTALCPICAGSFSVEVLPQHAATCGEISPPQPASPSSSPSSLQSVLWVSSPESSPPASWVQCPLCQLYFSAGEVEEHASMCGETPQT